MPFLINWLKSRFTTYVNRQTIETPNSFVNKGDPSKDLFLLNEEHELNDCLQEVKGDILINVQSGEFSEAMESLSLLSKPIDNFFESLFSLFCQGFHKIFL